MRAANLQQRNYWRNSYFVRGLAGGGLVMTLFGTVWGVAPASILPTTPLATAFALTAVGLITLALLAGCFALGHVGGRIPRDGSPEAVARGKAIGKRMGIRFGIVFGSEIVVIAAASTILDAIHQDVFIVPVVVLVVGLHFLPLAWLFRVWPYYATGTSLTLDALVTMLAVPKVSHVNGVELWTVVPATTSAIVLWLTALAVLLFGRWIVRATP